MNFGVICSEVTSFEFIQCSFINLMELSTNVSHFYHCGEILFSQTLKFQLSLKNLCSTFTRITPLTSTTANPITIINDIVNQPFILDSIVLFNLNTTNSNHLMTNNIKVNEIRLNLIFRASLLKQKCCK